MDIVLIIASVVLLSCVYALGFALGAARGKRVMALLEKRHADASKNALKVSRTKGRSQGELAVAINAETEALFLLKAARRAYSKKV